MPLNGLSVMLAEHLAIVNLKNKYYRDTECMKKTVISRFICLTPAVPARQRIMPAKIFRLGAGTACSLAPEPSSRTARASVEPAAL